jgi:sigma-B regulation protein RsbU (phosphoserine phosphatase)
MTTLDAGGRILVVDDDPGMLRAVARILGRGNEVITAASPSAALEAVAASKPDVAVLDVHMPEMNGFELLERLRGDDPELDVILMTGSVREPDAHLVRAIDEGAFYFIQKPFDRRVLRTLVARCLELRVLRQREQRRVARLERETRLARQFQRSLLPPEKSAIAGVAVSARYLACDELAGDLYDYAPAGDRGLAVLVADVSGHGTSAAMLTGIVKSAFRAANVEEYEPLAVVDRVSAGFRSFDARRFVTLFCARIDPEAGTLTFASAGHPPALVRCGDDAPVFLESSGPLISSGFRGVTWETRTVDFGRDDRLLLYTDGAHDVRGQEGMFGHERLVDAFHASDARGGPLLDDVIGAITTFAESRPFTDDITLLAADLEPAPQPGCEAGQDAAVGSSTTM